MSENKAQQQIMDPDEYGEKLSQGFLGWQCRIRQYSVRQGDGRPTPGMCPQISIGNDESLGNAITLIIKKDPEDITAQFMHMVKKTQDPLERWEGAIRHFSATYYQKPAEFSDHLTALFGSQSQMSDQVLKAGHCVLTFKQNRQIYTVPCEVVELAMEHSDYQATYWHNSLFNPNIPANSRVLSFVPDWSLAVAEPPVP